MTTEYEPARPRGTPATPDTDVSLAVQIAALKDLDYLALCVRYDELFGRPPRSTREAAFLVDERAFGVERRELAYVSPRA